MSPTLLAITLAIVYATGCIVYVYLWRGRTRYPTFSEFLGKSWPIFAPFNCLLYLTTRRSA